MNQTLIYQFLWYFIIYSFLGWVVEVAFQAVRRGKIINRGFLNGPICPVYGFGVVGIVLMTDSIETHMQGDLNIGILFVIGVVIATAIELLAGWLLDVMFHARWWDYSDQKLNFRGYVCLKFSLIWGAAIVLVIKLMQPVVKVNHIWENSQKYGWPILIVIYLAFFADLVVTVAMVQKMNRQLQELDQIQDSMRIVSNRLSEVVGGTTIKATQRIEEGQVQAALAKAEFRDAAAQKRTEFAGAMMQKKTEFTETADQMRTGFTEAADQMRTGFTEAADQMRTGFTEAADQMRTEFTEKKDSFVAAANTYKDETTESLLKRKEALQKRADELTDSMMHARFGAKRLMNAFPRMVPNSYKDAWAALKEKASLSARRGRKKED